MTEYIQNLIESVRNAEEEQRQLGKSPVLLLKMQDLEYHKVTIPEFYEKVNPFCAVISHLGVTSSQDNSSMPPGFTIESNYIVGHNKEQTELIWGVYTSDEAMAKTELNASLVVIYDGASPSRGRLCIQSENGPVFSDTKY